MADFKRVWPKMIKVSVVTIDLLSIGTKFEFSNFVQAGWRDSCLLQCILPKAHYSAQTAVLFFWTFLELPIPPSIICGFDFKMNIESVDLSILVSQHMWLHTYRNWTKLVDGACANKRTNNSRFPVIKAYCQII